VTSLLKNVMDDIHMLNHVESLRHHDLLNYRKELFKVEVLERLRSVIDSNLLVGINSFSK